MYNKKNIIEAIRLEFQPEIKEKILNLLSTFSSDELKNKRKFEATATKIDNGTAKFYTFDELDEVLEKTISKYKS